MKLYISQNIYYNTNDGYYYIEGNTTQYVTEDEAIDALN